MMSAPERVAMAALAKAKKVLKDALKAGTDGPRIPKAGGRGEDGGTKGGRAVLFRKLSSIKSVSTNPLKFCRALSFCKLMTVMALPSNSSGELLTSSSDGTSANGIILLSSSSSSNGIELVGDENLGGLPLPVSANCSSCSTALTWALRISRSKASLLFCRKASTTAAKSKSSVDNRLAMLVVD